MSAIDNIRIRQNWVQDETTQCASDIGTPDDHATAFQYLVGSLLLDCSPTDIDPADIVDGGQDKQIDFINIDDDDDKSTARIAIVQAKYTTSGFSSNTAIQIRNGLDWIFEKPIKDVQKLTNTLFRNKIEEIRQLRQQYASPNIEVYVYHVCNGDKTILADEYLQEAATLTEKYSTLGLGRFVFDQLGAHELIDLINEGDRSKRKVNLRLPVIYDVNRPSVIEFHQGDTKSLVCTVKGIELAKATLTEPRDAIFDMNVRPYYGHSGKVNREIWDTCSGTDAPRFWFLNNGITMVCESFDFTRDPDNAVVRITNAQIVNGCQTTVTIREAFEMNCLSDSVNVLVRVYATDNPSLVEKITLTTNNQNKITDRDLRANDSVQRDIEQRMSESYGYFYERKNKQYRSLAKNNKKKIVPSPKAAQAYLAIVRLKPSNARGYLSAIWSNFYAEIFQNASVADLLVAYKIYQLCHAKSLEVTNNTTLSVRERECRVYGVFHIARAIGHALLEDAWGHGNIQSVEKVLAQFENGKISKSVYTKALKAVMSVRQFDESTFPIPAMYFKHTVSQRNLNAKLLK